jgi:hypothetical protein
MHGGSDGQRQGQDGLSRAPAYALARGEGKHRCGGDGWMGRPSSASGDDQLTVVTSPDGYKAQQVLFGSCVKDRQYSLWLAC